MLGILGFVLSIKSDRYFPFPENLPEPVFQLLLIPFTLIFFTAVFCFLKPGIVPQIFSFLDRISGLRLSIAISLVFLGMTGMLLVVQEVRYASFGYALHVPIAVLLLAGTSLVFVYLFLRNQAPPLFFHTALIAYIGTYLLSIVSFPLHPARSDMLPLIVSGCRSFLSGITPYGYHNIPHHLIFTYLPGMWLPYLPWVALDRDPRLMSLLCIVLAVLLLAWSNSKGRETAYLLLPVFILTPYLAYRHETYLGVLFLVLALASILYQRSKWLSCGAVFGYALATYQFSWVIFPFFVVAAFRKTGIFRALVSMGVGIGVALALILPFFLSSRGDFLGGIYGHWQYVFVPNINLSYFASFIVPWEYMIVLQGVVIGAILAISLRRMEPGEMWGWMAVGLLFFISLNRIIEVYFYLLVLLLLAIHGIAVSERTGGSGNNGNYL